MRRLIPLILVAILLAAVGVVPVKAETTTVSEVVNAKIPLVYTLIYTISGVSGNTTTLRYSTPEGTIVAGVYTKLKTTLPSGAGHVVVTIRFKDSAGNILIEATSPELTAGGEWVQDIGAGIGEVEGGILEIEVNSTIEDIDLVGFSFAYLHEASLTYDLKITEAKAVVTYKPEKKVAIWAEVGGPTIELADPSALYIGGLGILLNKTAGLSGHVEVDGISAKIIENTQADSYDIQASVTAKEVKVYIDFVMPFRSHQFKVKSLKTEKEGIVSTIIKGEKLSVEALAFNSSVTSTVNGCFTPLKVYAFANVSGNYYTGETLEFKNVGSGEMGVAASYNVKPDTWWVTWYSGHIVEIPGAELLQLFRVAWSIEVYEARIQQIKVVNPSGEELPFRVTTFTPGIVEPGKYKMTIEHIEVGQYEYVASGSTEFYIGLGTATYKVDTANYIIYANITYTFQEAKGADWLVDGFWSNTTITATKVHKLKYELSFGSIPAILVYKTPRVGNVGKSINEIKVAVVDTSPLNVILYGKVTVTVLKEGKPVKGVTVNIYDSQGNRIAARRTDTAGKAEFTLLGDQNYRVEVVSGEEIQSRTIFLDEDKTLTFTVTVTPPAVVITPTTLQIILISILIILLIAGIIIIVRRGFKLIVAPKE